MKNKANDLLENINNEFNNSLPDSGFSLSKMFKRDGMPSKMVNLLLLTACTTGAFSGNAFASDSLEQNQTKSQVEQSYETMRDTFVDVTDINAKNIVEISESNEGGVYNFHGSDRLIALTFDSNLDNLKPEAKNWLDVNNLNTANESRAVFKIKQDDIAYANIANYDYSQDNVELTENQLEMFHPDYVPENAREIKTITPDETPMLHQNHDLFVLAHELSHLNDNQVDLTVNNNEMTKIEKTLTKEAASDIFGIMAVSKAKDLNLDDTIQLLDDVSQWRSDNVSLHKDVEHGTTPILNEFKENITNNPEMFDDIKSLDFNNLDDTTSKFAFSTMEHLDFDFQKHDEIMKNEDFKYSRIDLYENERALEDLLREDLDLSRKESNSIEDNLFDNIQSNQNDMTAESQMEEPVNKGELDLEISLKSELDQMPTKVASKNNDRNNSLRMS